MFVAASPLAQSVLPSRAPSQLQEPRAERAGEPAALDPAARPDDPSAAANKVQPAGKTEKVADSTASKTASGEPLTEEQERQVQQLKQTDAKVRAHEQAHAAAGGPYAGAPSYQFTTGPDGKRYATSGEVEIDVTPIRGNPEATIRKMDTVIRAALAPAEPSSQDLAVARTAQQQRTQAQAELAKQRTEELSGGGDGTADRTADASASDAPAASIDLLAQALTAYGEDADQRATALAEDIFSVTQQVSFFA